VSSVLPPCRKGLELVAGVHEFSSVEYDSARHAEPVDRVTDRTMRVLILTPLVPYPPYRGDKLKVYNLIRNLSRTHEIVLLAFTNSRKDRENVPPLRGLCAEVRTAHLPVWQSFLKAALNIFSGRPFQIAYFSSGRMRSAVRHVLTQQRFDVIHTHSVRMAQYTSALRGVPRILDQTDAVSLYLKRFAEKEHNGLKRFLLKTECRRMERYEKVIGSFDRTLVCSEVDRQVLLKSAPAAGVSLLENGVDLEYFSPNGAMAPEPGTIICTGNMSYFPNADGVKRRVPGAKFFIVGQNPPASVRRLAAPDIVVTGAVPDIRAYYQRCMVAVSPIRFGSGTLNKVLEPMALGVPVVATPVGTEGLPVRDGEHLLIAESAERFAGCVADLLENAELRGRLSSGAREIVRGRYGWVTIARRLEAIYGELLKDTGTGQGA
jgi:sugar transferase (PEP-CTERM/EpsH1 system associated)